MCRASYRWGTILCDSMQLKYEPMCPCAHKHRAKHVWVIFYSRRVASGNWLDARLAIR